MSSDERQAANGSTSQRTVAPILILFAVWGIIAALLWLAPGLPEAKRFHWFSLSGLAVGTPFAIWFAKLGNLKTTTRLSGLVAVVSLALCCWTSVVQDGYYGDASPLYRWRSLATTSDTGSTPPGKATDTLAVKASSSGVSSPYAGPKWDYAQFLGPQRNGKVAGPQLNTDWSAHPPVERWRVPVGEAWSSFALTDKYAITQEQLNDDEAIVCRDFNTGQAIWTVKNEGVRFGETYGGYGPRATPTVFGDHVYTLGAAGDLHCLELATGNVTWQTNILNDANAENIKWGMSGSPLVFDDTVVVAAGGTESHSLIAYERNTGTIQWHAGNGKSAYSSPMLVEFAGQRQVVLLNGPGLESYAIEDGQLLWEYPWIVNANMMTSITQPIAIPTKNADACQFFVTGGYGKGCVLINVKGSGDKFDVQEMWEPNRNLKAKFNTVIHHNGFAYGMDDQILVCVDLSDGSRRWKKGRFGYGQLLLVDNILVVQAENGDVALVRPNPDKFEEICRVSPLSRKTWNNPAIRGNRLVIRNDAEAVCLELPVTPTPEL